MAIARQRPPGNLVSDQKVDQIHLRLLGAAMRRRMFLKLAGGAATSAIVSPTSLLAQATSGLNKIDHFVILMLENRSFDSMLGMLGRY